MIHLEGCYCRELGNHETYLPAGEATATRGAKGKNLLIISWVWLLSIVEGTLLV